MVSADAGQQDTSQAQAQAQAQTQTGSDAPAVSVPASAAASSGSSKHVGAASGAAATASTAVDTKRKHAGFIGCREESASIISRIFLGWVGDVLARANDGGGLEHEDLGSAAAGDQLDGLYERFVVAWEASKQTGKPALFSCLLKATGTGLLWLGAFLAFIQAGLALLTPVVFSHLIASFATPQPDRVWQWLYAASFFVFPMISAVAASHENIIMARMGIRFRSILSTAMYRKSLVANLGACDPSQYNTGSIMNIMNADTAQMQWFMFGINQLWVAPATVAVGVYLLWQQVDWTALLGLAVITLTGPLNAIFFGKLHKLYFAKMKLMDSRVRFINEMLAGVRIIKYYAWETPIIKKIRSIRTKELAMVRSFMLYIAIGLQLVTGSTRVVMVCVVFLVYTRGLGNILTSSRAFSALQLFNVIHQPFVSLPWTFVTMLQAMTSMGRIRGFLMLPELPVRAEADLSADNLSVRIVDAQFQYSRVQSSDKPDAKKPDAAAKTADAAAKTTDAAAKTTDAAAAKDATETPKPAAEPFSLRVPQLEVRRGEFLAIVGAVGSGKSTLINSILGEVPAKSGQVQVSGSIAYASQQAWIMNSTVHDNIVFWGRKDEEWYRKVKSACQLDSDIAQLIGHDQCEIGERGINLSGGQKARVSLARAVYADADIIIADDPLAAVDSHVADALFHKCFKSFVAAKTRILVTNQLQFLSEVDRIAVIDHGQVVEIGTYAELMGRDSSLHALMQRLGNNDDEEDEEQDAPGESADGKAEDGTERRRATSRARSESRARGESRARAASTAPKTDTEQGKLVEDEARQVGRVKASTYFFYLKYFHWMSLFGIIFFLLVSKGAEIATTFWLGNWTAALAPGGSELDNFIIGFALLSLSVIIALFIQGLITAFATVAVSHKMHDSMLLRVLRAPIAFFDVTPAGRVVNRFSKDMDVVDQSIGRLYSFAAQAVFGLLSSLVTILVATNGMFLVILFPVAVVYVRIAALIRAPAVELQRLESTSRSPIYSNFGETINGVTSIRAYGKQVSFVLRNDSFVTRNMVPALTLNMAQKWLGIRLNLLGATIALAVALLSVSLNVTQSTLLPIQFMAIGLTYALQVTGALQGVIEAVAALEAQLAGVERVGEYMSLPQQEAPAEIPETYPGDTWPAQGSVKLENFEMRYREGPRVLKGITASVAGGEKIGIVGRTGAGKSSLMVGLFRIEEPAGGRILIDGVDITAIGLNTLRSRLGIIPQDPVLFTGTVRYNLDPFDEATDDDVWNALKRVQLDEYVRSLPNGLSGDVAEGGSNFSLGQRQLMCMARALLRKPKLLVLDEATASVDQETDATLQLMIRECFKDATVLTIAHRLDTIMDSDRIMVLDKGLVVEFDSPVNLLDMPAGVFHSMVSVTGPRNMTRLRHMAETKQFVRVRELPDDPSLLSPTGIVPITLPEEDAVQPADDSQPSQQ